MNGFLQNLFTSARQILAGAKEARNLSLSQLRKVFSLMGKYEKITLLLLILAAILSLAWSSHNFYITHTHAVPGSGGSYTEALLGQPAYINPLLAHTEADLSLTRLVFSGLYKFNAKGDLTPDLADGMPNISADQKQYTINLKRNVKWHNGKPLTSDDVIFTFQTIKDPDFKSPARNIWLSTNVEKVSDYTIKFTTKDISAPFIFNLTQAILPKNIWEKTEAQNFLLSKNNLEAIGSGPYAIKEIKKMASGKVQQITLQANGSYFDSKAKIDQIVVKFYDSEEDILNALHSREILGYGFLPLASNLYLNKTQANLNIYTLPLPQYQVVFFNLSKKTLSDLPVRQALDLSIDKSAIISQVFNGNALLPVSPLTNNGQLTAQPQTTEFNINKAKALLDSAGWIIDEKTGFRTKKSVLLELTIATNDSSINSKTAEFLAAAWKNLNIKINLSVQPTKQLTDNVIRPRNFDVLLFPQKFGPDPDPFIFWHSSQVKDPGLNLTGFNSPDADKLITEARSTTDREVRQAKYAQLDKLIAGAEPVIYLDQMVYLYALDSTVKNLQLTQLFEPSQRFYDATNWYINTARVWRK